MSDYVKDYYELEAELLDAGWSVDEIEALWRRWLQDELQALWQKHPPRST